METVSLNDPNHKFSKVNLVTQRGRGQMFDTYKCEYCGLTGKRFGIGSNSIHVRKEKICTHKAEIIPPAKQENLGKVKIVDNYPCNQFGFKLNEIYDRVPCPQEEMEKYSNDVWVYSEQRKEPIRLLPNEAIKISE